MISRTPPSPSPSSSSSILKIPQISLQLEFRHAKFSQKLQINCCFKHLIKVLKESSTLYFLIGSLLIIVQPTCKRTFAII